MALHKGMSVEAFHVKLDPRVETACTVRDHTKTKAFGDMAGFDYGPAERVTLVPEIVLLAAQVSPVRGDVISIAADEAYEIETVMPVDGITRTVQVTRMKQSDIDALALPIPEAV